MSESEAGNSESNLDIVQRRKHESDTEEAYSQLSDPTSDNLPYASGRVSGRPRKRKLSTAVKHSQSKAKRLRADYRDEYRKLYNEEIENVTDGPPNDEEAFEMSQHGLSVWNASEKAVLFRSLDRRGRYDLRGIASDVGSKNEPEISQYIKLLQESLAQACSRTRPPKSLQRPLEAAFELNPECTEALDRCADALSALQQRDEEANEIAKHGDMWLLTPSIGRWAEGCIKDDGKRAELISSLPEADLLNLKSFLDLSKSLFMNSSDAEHNWRTYSERVQAPAIRKTAFMDLHTVVVSLSKKIAKSAIFVALSRIRATDSHFYEVKKRDVSTALSILGITSSAKDYWIGLAKRCNLRVYNEVRRSKPMKREYSYKEVEDLLTLKRADYLAESRSRGQSERESRGFPDSSSDEMSESRPSPPVKSASQSISSPFPSSVSAPESYPSPMVTIRSNSPPDISDSELLQIQEDSKLDDLDLEGSAQEELRLYDLLEIQHGTSDDVSTKLDQGREDVGITRESSHIFRAPEIEDNWASWTEYRAEWENPAGPVQQWEFDGNDEQRGRRRENEDLTDEELNAMEDILESEGGDSTSMSSTAEVESNTDSSKVDGPSQSDFEYREQVPSEEHESSDAIESQDGSVFLASPSPSDISQDYSLEEEGEEEEQDDDEDEAQDDERSAEE